MHDGKGKTLAYAFFQGKIDSSMMFFDLVLEPGAYAGYHRHEGNEEILYIVSGKAENFQDGNRCILGPGDAILVNMYCLEPLWRANHLQKVGSAFQALSTGGAVHLERY